MYQKAYFSVGSNLGDRRRNVLDAFQKLQDIGVGFHASRLHETAPSGFASQPKFINAACSLWTYLDPFELLECISHINTFKTGRRVVLNGPRALDIDLLLYGSLVIRSPHLTVPHPRMTTREFVLRPLSEIEGELTHPLLGSSINTLLARLVGKMDKTTAVSS